MPILVMCQDSADGVALRKKHNKAHLAYIEKVFPLICVTGPLKQSTDAIKNDYFDGSCFIYDTNDMIVARKLLNNDPYAKGGVYAQVAFAEFNPAAGHWIGGMSWK